MVEMAAATLALPAAPLVREGVRLELVSARPAAGKLELPVDGRAIQQALVNLLDNAIKHSARGQTVKLELADDEPAGCRLTVEDDGRGIPLAEQARIFERFYRLGSELRRETQGIGIGLSIVRHIMAAHGGEVTVKSAPGRGSRFTLHLPGKS